MSVELKEFSVESQWKVNYALKFGTAPPTKPQPIIPTLIIVVLYWIVYYFS